MLFVHGGGHGTGPGEMSGPMWMPMEPPTLERLFAIHPQPVPLVPVLAVIALALYAAGVLALRRKGSPWQVGRSVAWVAGLVLVLAVTATGIEGYSMRLLSVHMGQHMVLTMAAPILLSLGAPITLLLRALPTKGRGSVLRRSAVGTLHSWPSRVVMSIPVRWFLFLSGLYAIYFTPVFDYLMATVWGHNLMLVHFLATGLVFFAPLVGADPMPGKPTHLLRMVETLLSTPFHAFFGIAMMMATEPVVSFFTAPPDGWGVDVMADQNAAGGITWVFTEIPTVMLLGAILVQWYTSEQRASARERRSPERADEELRAYNEYLAQLSRRR